jgi:hypothetical protein
MADWRRGEARRTAGEWGKLSSHGGLVMVLSLLLLYVASAGSAPSAAVVTSARLILEPAEPASWQQLLHSGSVLQSRVRTQFPPADVSLHWEVQGGRLVVTVPAEVPADWLTDEASQRGEFELVDGGTQFLPLGRRVQSGPLPRPEMGIYEVVLSSDHFITATARTQNGRPAVEFALTPEGDARLAAHTDRQRGYYLCILVDEEVVNCPILRTPLSHRRGVMELTGTASLAHARRLAMLMLSGPLPVSLRAVGATANW